MKRILLGFAVFTLSMTSCQKGAVVDDINSDNNRLTFGVHQGKATKAAELMNSDLNKDGVKFPLYAYKGAQNGTKTVYFDETLTYGTPDAGKWNTSKPRFLTESTPLQFYAYYAPRATQTDPIVGATYNPIPEGDLSTNTYPTLDYIIQNTITDKTPDLIAAGINDHQGPKVTIPFRHILSQINFGVKGYYGAKIEIKNIQIMRVNSEAKFTFDPATWNWSGQKTAADYIYPFATDATDKNQFTTPGQATTLADESTYLYILGDGGNWGPGEYPTTWYVKSDGTTVQGNAVTPNENPKNSLILMPQSFTSVTDMTKAYVTFDYSIRDLDNNYIIGSLNAPEKGKFTLNMGANGIQEWKPNLRYVYVIDFTDYLDSKALSFTVSVEEQPWENHDNLDGIIYLNSSADPMFNEIQNLPINTTHTMKPGHVFSDLTWNWTNYTMVEKRYTVAGDKFTIDFSKVLFNGNKITVTPPKGFTVTPTNGIANKDAQSLVFTSMAEPTLPTVTNNVIVNGVIAIPIGVFYEDKTLALNAPTAPFTVGQSYTVDASAVWFNGWKLTITPPADFKVTGLYPIFTITKIK